MDRGALGQCLLREFQFVLVSFIPTVLRTNLQVYQYPVITIIIYSSFGLGVTNGSVFALVM